MADTAGFFGDSDAETAGVAATGGLSAAVAAAAAAAVRVEAGAVRPLYFLMLTFKNIV